MPPPSRHVVCALAAASGSACPQSYVGASIDGAETHQEPSLQAHHKAHVFRDCHSKYELQKHPFWCKVKQK